MDLILKKAIPVICIALAAPFVFFLQSSNEFFRSRYSGKQRSSGASPFCRIGRFARKRSSF